MTKHIMFAQKIPRRFVWFFSTKRRKVFSILLSVLILLTSFRFLFFKPQQVLAADVYIAFNEGYGTSARDTNSSINAGTITNAVWKTEDLCKFGKCLYFDGSGDYVSYSDDANLDMGASDDVTIELWFRTSDITSGTRTLIAKEEPTGADGGYRIQMNSSGQIVFGIDNDNTSFPLYSVTSSGSYDDNKWHHIAAVKSGTSSMTLYIDGQSVGTTSITSTDASNDDTFYIGIYNGASDGFLGFIDEVKIMRSARNASEVKSDFLGATPSRGTSASFGPNQSYLSEGLVGYWKMDEATNGASATDSSGNSSTLTDSGTVARTGGKFGYASDFEMSSSQYQYTVDNTILSITGSLTLSAWIRPESTTSGIYNIIAKWDGANESYRLVQNGDEIRLELDSSGNYQETSSSNLSSSTWYHVVGVYDSSSQTAKIFINGVEATSTTTGTIPSSIGDDISRFHIGAEDSSSTASNFYDGIIDEVRIYNRTLSPAEVKNLYNWAPGPIGWWKMDEGSGQTLADSSGNNNNGTLGLDSSQETSDPSWTIGKLGSGLDFDGSNDLAMIGNNLEIFQLGEQSLSVSAWIWRNTSGTIDSISSNKVSSSSPGYQLTIWDTNQFSINISDGTDSYECYTSAGAVSTGAWHYVAGVIDKYALTCKVYIDGIDSTSGSSGDLSSVGSLTDTSSNDSLTIGSHQQYSGWYFAGKIDDFRIYNYARTQAQIIEDMNGGHPAPGSPIGSAVAHWKFDDMSGTTAQDSSQKDNNLTLSTASWTTSGKFGGAWNGTGSLWVSRADDPDFDISATDDYSVSLWFKSDSATNPSATEYLFNKANATTAGYAVYVNTSGQICFGIDDDTTWNPDIASCTTDDYYDAKWHNFGAIRDYSQTDKTHM